MPGGKTPQAAPLQPNSCGVTAVTALRVEALQRCLRALQNRLEPSYAFGLMAGLRNNLTLYSRQIDPEDAAVPDDFAPCYV
jgi:hypothetical protein